MKVDSINDVPFSQCKNAAVYPEGIDQFRGTLEVGDSEYALKIIRETNKKHHVSRVWAFVLVGAVRARFIDAWSMQVAQKGIEDRDWARVGVDLIDGDTAYMKTWTCDFPDDEAMDVFLAEAAAFLGANQKTFGEFGL